MPRRGPKPGHLRLVEATDAVPDGGQCRRATGSGGLCSRKAGSGTDHPGDGPCWQHDEPERGSDFCPVELRGDEERIWRSLATDMRALGLLRPLFWPTMYGLVVALARLVQANREVGEAMTVKGDNSAQKKHPAATIVHQMLTQVRMYSAELGITPSALAKVGVEKGDDPSELERLIRGD